MMVPDADLYVWEWLPLGEGAYFWLSSGSEKMSGIPQSS